MDDVDRKSTNENESQGIIIRAPDEMATPQLNVIKSFPQMGIECVWPEPITIG